MLAARNLTVVRGAQVVLDGVDLVVDGTSRIGVLGRNGAGKTTLLRSIAGVHLPARGTVTVGDRVPSPGIDVALCPQEPEVLLFAETVGEEVRATRRARRLPDDPGPTLEALGISALATRHPREVSAGQRLLVAVAAVAAAEAPVLLLDEPTRGLDPWSKERLAGFLRTHAAGGGAAMVATHDVELAASFASRVVILAGGEVIADGDPGVVLGDSTVFAPQMTRAFGAGWLTPEQVAEALA
jgi:energy-coupling factor transport system ATP-binding protein